MFTKPKTDTSDTSIGGVRSVTEGLFVITLTKLRFVSVVKGLTKTSNTSYGGVS